MELDKKEFTLKGKAIYKKIEPKLKDAWGKIVAIDVESGNYVLGDDELEAALKARERFPGKVFAFFRVGYPSVHKFREVFKC